LRSLHQPRNAGGRRPVDREEYFPDTVHMCGRVIQKSGLRLAIIAGTVIDDPSVRNFEARYNGAPRQELLIIRRHPDTGLPTMSAARWGLIHRNLRQPRAPSLEAASTAPHFDTRCSTIEE
jgi:putative SOS response-associated peptidase YedK